MTTLSSVTRQTERVDGRGSVPSSIPNELVIVNGVGSMDLSCVPVSSPHLDRTKAEEMCNLPFSPSQFSVC